MNPLTFDSVSDGDKLPDVVRTVDQETFWKFAAASFDYNPVHCDPEWVKTARPFTLETTVGHGMMTAAFMSSVVTQWMLPTVLQVRKASVKFTFPVMPGWTKQSEYGQLFVHPVFITSIIFWCIGTKGRGNWIRTPGARNPGQSCIIHEYLRVGETIHIRMKPHDRFIKRGKFHLQYKVDLYNQDNVLKVETITTLILPRDRESIRKFLRGERGLDD